VTVCTAKRQRVFADPKIVDMVQHVVIETCRQRSFFDRTLRHDDEPWQLIRYIVNNPVRAALVSAPDEYRWWGSTIYTRQQIMDAILLAPT
jgi:hypothetical protein